MSRFHSFCSAFTCWISLMLSCSSWASTEQFRWLAVAEIFLSGSNSASFIDTIWYCGKSFRQLQYNFPFEKLSLYCLKILHKRHYTLVILTSSRCWQPTTWISVLPRHYLIFIQGHQSVLPIFSLGVLVVAIRGVWWWLLQAIYNKVVQQAVLQPLACLHWYYRLWTYHSWILSYIEHSTNWRKLVLCSDYVLRTWTQ